MPAFKIQSFNPAIHRRSEFSCESQELTTFLQERARKEMEAGASACFVLVPEDDPGKIAGFYTLSAAEVETTGLPENMVKKLPRYLKMPATLLGRLARDSAFKGKGVGDLLMVDALARALSSSRDVGSLLVITDPKNAHAFDFYREFGFVPLNKTRLFLPMKDVKRWIARRTV